MCFNTELIKTELLFCGKELPTVKLLVHSINLFKEFGTDVLYAEMIDDEDVERLFQLTDMGIVDVSEAKSIQFVDSYQHAFSINKNFK